MFALTPPLFTQPAAAPAHADPWAAVPDLFRRPDAALPTPWDTLFGPLRKSRVDDLVVVAQMGQSIDGRIATASGRPSYINGAAGLDHLHRLRALVDAVVIGVNTAIADDPQLTVRRVAGPQPARVVIDPRRRLPGSARLLREDGARRLVVVAEGIEPQLPAGVEVVWVPPSNGETAPATILAELASRGFTRVLVEGGARTVSGFLAAGCLDRLHIVVAPILLGGGPHSPALASALRADGTPPVYAHLLGNEVLFDVDLSAQRMPIGRANTSR